MKKILFLAVMLILFSVAGNAKFTPVSSFVSSLLPYQTLHIENGTSAQAEIYIDGAYYSVAANSTENFSPFVWSTSAPHDIYISDAVDFEYIDYEGNSGYSSGGIASYTINVSPSYYSIQLLPALSL